MKLSTTTSVLFNTFGYEKGIEVAAEVGFDALDLNLIHPIYDEEFSEKNLEKTCKMLTDEAKKNGICFNQAHSPFPSYQFGENMDEYNAKVKPALIASIKAAGLVGAEQIIVHPIDCTTVDIDQKKFNIDFYNSLVPYCKEYNVKVALENMWKGDGNGKIIPNVCSFGKDLAEYYDELDPKYFTVCLDLGHSGLVGDTAQDAIRVLGKERLYSLHVHDNDFIHDTHTIPYQGDMDWDAIMEALSEIGYEGDFTYEVGGKLLKPYTDKPELMKKMFELLADTGKYLIGKFNG